MKTTKRVITCIVAVAGVAVLGLALLRIANPDPVLTIENISKNQAIISFDTDVGESYPSHSVAAGSNFKTTVSGRDKLLFVVATFPDGKTARSQGIYSTSGAQLKATVTSDAVHISYVQG